LKGTSGRLRHERDACAMRGEAGFVSSAEDYLCSSARDYAGEQGLLKITLLD